MRTPKTEVDSKDRKLLSAIAILSVRGETLTLKGIGQEAGHITSGAVAYRLRWLAERGFLIQRERSWELTRDGLALISKPETTTIEEATRWANMLALAKVHSERIAEWLTQAPEYPY
jgi:predicted transcriptional regulator